MAQDRGSGGFDGQATQMATRSLANNAAVRQANWSELLKPWT